jgi:hypothetical protein
MEKNEGSFWSSLGGMFRSIVTIIIFTDERHFLYHVKAPSHDSYDHELQNPRQLRQVLPQADCLAVRSHFVRGTAAFVQLPRLALNGGCPGATDVLS